jgi:hypothetical protein
VTLLVATRHRIGLARTGATEERDLPALSAEHSATLAGDEEAGRLGLAPPRGRVVAADRRIRDPEGPVHHCAEHPAARVQRRPGTPRPRPGRDRERPRRRSRLRHCPGMLYDLRFPAGRKREQRTESGHQPRHRSHTRRDALRGSEVATARSRSGHDQDRGVRPATSPTSPMSGRVSRAAGSPRRAARRRRTPTAPRRSASRRTGRASRGWRNGSPVTRARPG